MSTEGNKAIVRRLVDEGQSQGKLQVVDELLAADFVDHSPLPGVPPTRDGVRALFAALREGFPDLQVRIHDQIAEGDRVATRKTFHGTHRGPFLGIPATGRPVAFDVIDILELRAGKITAHWCVVDQLALLRAVGAIPPA